MPTLSEEGGMTQPVFISYAHADRDFVDGLANGLEKAGVPVWYDKSLRGGDTWPRELAAHIEEACAVCVVVTPASAKSDWVLEEITYAKGRGVKIIPYWLSGDLFFSLTSKQAVKTFSDLVVALGNPAPPPPAPNPFMPIFEPITDAAQVYGREADLRSIHNVLKSGGNVALIGESGVGKSSLLTLLCAQPPRISRKAIRLDLSLIRSDAEFYSRLCELVGIADCHGYALSRALQSAGRRYLLCLDEVGKMTSDGFSRDLRLELRGYTQSDEQGVEAPLKLVLAAPQSLDRMFADSGLVSPLANVCAEVRVGRWDEATCRGFIDARLSGSGVTFDKSQIAQLVHDSDGHPQRLVRAAFDLYEHLTGGSP